MRWLPWRSAPTRLPDRPDCRQVERVVQSFLDGELRPDDAEVVALHLRECDRCGLDAQVVREVIAVIRRQRPDLDPEPLARLAGFADDPDRTDPTSEAGPDVTG